MVILTAVLQARQGREDELRNALLAMIPETAKEEGAVEYRMHESRTNPGSYFFYEKYSSQQALDAHFESPHYKALIERVGGILKSPPSVDTLDFIEGIPETRS